MLEIIMKMNVYIPDNMETNFRKAVYERLGYKKGNLNRAIGQAIDLWLHYSGEELGKDTPPQVQMKMKKFFDEEIKPTIEKNKIESVTVKFPESNFEDKYSKLSFKELYNEYRTLKDLTDPIAIEKCGVIIRVLNKMILAKNTKGGKRTHQHNYGTKSIKSISV